MDYDEIQRALAPEVEFLDAAVAEGLIAREAASASYKELCRRLAEGDDPSAARHLLDSHRLTPAEVARIRASVEERPARRAEGGLDDETFVRLALEARLLGPADVEALEKLRRKRRKKGKRELTLFALARKRGALSEGQVVALLEQVAAEASAEAEPEPPPRKEARTGKRRAARDDAPAGPPPADDAPPPPAPAGPRLGAVLAVVGAGAFVLVAIAFVAGVLITRQAAEETADAETPAPSVDPAAERLERYARAVAVGDDLIAAARFEEAIANYRAAEAQLDGTPWAPKVAALRRKAEGFQADYEAEQAARAAAREAEAYRSAGRAPPGEEAADPPEVVSPSPEDGPAEVEQPPPPDDGPDEVAQPEPPPDRPDRPVRVDPNDVDRALLKEVDRAIERGVAWLRPAAATGHPGVTALKAFALLRCGVPADDPAVAALFDRLRRSTFLDTYSLAVYLMALEARYVHREELAPLDGMRSTARYERAPVGADDLSLMREVARRLAQGRIPGEGVWTYQCVDPETRQRPQGPGRSQTDRVTGRQAGDHSNTQFAILGLHAARRSGVEVEVAVWEEVLDRFVAVQEDSGPRRALEVGFNAHAPEDLFALPEGTGTRTRRAEARGWPYSTDWIRRSPYDAMVAAGLSTVVICWEALRASGQLTPERQAAAGEAARDGLAWLVWRMDLSRAAIPDWYYYHLYSFEKAMEVSGVEYLAQRDWWAEGSRELLGRQEASGAWAGGDVDDTCLALLFLARATLSLHTETVVGGPRGRDVVHVEGEGAVDASAFLRDLATPTGESIRSRLRDADDVLEAFPPGRLPVVVPALVTLLDHEVGAVKRFARRALKDATGERHREAGPYLAWHETWDRLDRAGERLDYRAIPVARGVLRDPDASDPLVRAALLALHRLRAAEAAPELIATLEHDEEELRRLAYDALRYVTNETIAFEAGGYRSEREAAVERWRRWWREEGDAQAESVRIERLVRVVAGARPGATAAWDELVAIGEPAVPEAIDAYAAEPDAPWLRKLLVALTGEDQGSDPEAWRAWWGERSGR